MASLLDKNSVEYLRTDIERRQLFSQNKGPVAIITPADVLPSPNPDFALEFRTTGNGIIYLSGRGIMQNAIAGGTAIFRVPDRVAASFTQSLLGTLFQVGAALAGDLALEITGNIISAAPGTSGFGVATDEIFLNGAFYFTG